MDANAVVVDDSSGRFLHEGDNWYIITTDNQAIHNGTLSESQGPGTLSILFTGSQISVYGAISPVKNGKAPTAVTSVYIIDDIVMGTYTAPNVTDEVDGIMFWTSGTIDVNKHNLVVNITNASPDYPFLFDYLFFMPPPVVTSNPFQTSSSSPSSASSTSSSRSSLSNGISLSGPTSAGSTTLSGSQSVSPAPQAFDSTSTRNHTGAIVGGVVGGIVFLVVVLGALFYLCRRRGNALPRELDDAEDSPIQEVGVGGIIGVTPYLLPRDYNTLSASVVSPETAGPLTPSAVSGTPMVATIQRKARLTSSPLAGPSSNAGDNSGSQQRLLTPEPSVISSSQALGSVTSDRNGPVAPSRQGSSTDGSVSGPDVRRRVRRKGSPSPSLSPAAPPNPSSAPHRPPALHADSGLRFTEGELPPGVADEVQSQAPTEFPPAYTPQ